MSVHQKKDGRWFLKYKNPDPAGPAYIYRYFGRGHEAEAEARKEDALQKRRETGAACPALSFADIAWRYLAFKNGEMSEDAHDALTWKLSGVIFPLIGGLLVREITPETMDRYVAARRSDGVKNVTISGEIGYIITMLRWAVSRGAIPSHRLEGYRKPKRDDEIILPPTVQEFENILKYAPPHLYRALLLAYYTGSRPGKVELFRLKWSDIDFYAQQIRIISARKGGLPFRMVPIHSGFLEILTTWKQADGDEAEYLITWHGGPVKSLKKSYATAKKKAGITRRLPLYAFRHLFVTGLLDREGDLKSVSELVGHSRPDTTLRRYQHSSPELHRRTIEKLPPVGNKKTKKVAISKI